MLRFRQNRLNTQQKSGGTVPTQSVLPDYWAQPLDSEAAVTTGARLFSFLPDTLLIRSETNRMRGPTRPDDHNPSSQLSPQQCRSRDHKRIIV